MTILLSREVRTMFSFGPTNSREEDTSFFENLGLREFRMKQRKYKRGLGRKNSLCGWKRQFFDLKLSSINLIYMLSDSGHMILSNVFQHLARSHVRNKSLVSKFQITKLFQWVVAVYYLCNFRILVCEFAIMGN